jgi:hypothetical protein
VAIFRLVSHQRVDAGGIRQLHIECLQSLCGPRFVVATRHNVVSAKPGRSDCGCHMHGPIALEVARVAGAGEPLGY